MAMKPGRDMASIRPIDMAGCLASGSPCSQQTDCCTGFCISTCL
jgi:hypothetical protein